MDTDFNTHQRWIRRDLKHNSRKRFVSDNRKSIRWLYMNAGSKVKKNINFKGEDTDGKVVEQS